ncbi:hypothetical protein ACFQZ1_10885 [Bacillus sp. CGMCC 1.60114]|uniref:hypothetical protein n=1 Tax=unclassified Bacillus (in: firmicutes) TaxID=185979 RepID=UPI00363CAFF6
MNIYQISFAYTGQGKDFIYVKSDNTLVQMMNHFGNKVAECAAIGYIKNGVGYIVNLENVESVEVQKPAIKHSDSIEMRDISYFYTAE